MPFCYDGKKDFFEPMPWNFTAYSNMCYQKWRVMPRPFMTKNEYGGENILAASNIIFRYILVSFFLTGVFFQYRN